MPLLGGSFLKAGNEISVFQNENLIKITGVIKDSKGEPLIGVNVGVKGSSEGTISDLDGRFALDVLPNSILVVSI